jgi:Ca2+-binding EF-hand superfamily protein
VRQCQELFGLADKDKDGFLSKEEFRWLIKALGIWKGDKEAADNIFKAYDYNGDGRMGNCRSGEFSAFIGQPEMVEKVLKFLKGELGTKG